MPSSLTAKDIAKLMLKFPNVKMPEDVEAGPSGALLLLAGTCVVSMSLVEVSDSLPRFLAIYWNFHLPLVCSKEGGVLIAIGRWNILCRMQ